MKLSCLQENMSKSLDVVGHAVATRSTLPVLSNILLATDSGRLKLSATNLEVGVSCWIGAKVEEEGSTTVPARTLSDLVDALPHERIDISLAARTQTLNLRCGRFQNNIRGLDPAEFPLLPSLDPAPVMRAAADMLKAAINQVVFAAATDDKRPILAGVLADFFNDAQSGQGKLTLAAADTCTARRRKCGFRLAVRTMSLVEPVAKPVSVIVPAKALALLSRTSNGQQAPVSIHVTPSKSQVLFHLDNVDLAAQLIDGAFPEWEKIVPKGKQVRVVAKSSEVLKACKAASVFARDSSNIVRLTVAPGSDIEPGHVTVQATSAEAGDNVGQLDALVEGSALQIGLNVNYVMDAVSAACTEQIALEMTTPSSPVVFRPVGQDSSLCAVMPMSLKN